VAFTSSSLDFGTVPVGTNKNIQDTLTNGTASSVTISSIQGLNGTLQVTGISLPLVVPAGQSSSFNVQFKPNAPGTTSATLSYMGDGGQSLASLKVVGQAVAQGQLSANPSSVSFGNVPVGSNAGQSVTLINSGGENVTISAATASGNGFSLSGLTLPLTLSPGASTSFTAKFSPSVAGAVNGTITITSDASNSPLSISLSGTAVAPGTLNPSPASLSFGNVQVGSNASLNETLSNTGASPVTITAASVSGSGFSLSGLNLPLTLNAGQNTSFTVKFAPSAAGSASGNVTVTSNASNSPLDIAASGTGVAPGALSANPSSLAFGNVQVGSNSSLSETLTNTGGSSVTISAASVGNSAYTLIGLSLPLTLNAGQNTTFTVKFTPSAAGAANANLTITSNAPGSPLTIPLTGTGVAQGALSPNPSSLAFGNVQVGSNSSLTETLTNSGGSSVTISAASVNNSAYTLIGLSLPLTLNAGQNTTFTVKFTPSAAGAANANLTITSNAPGSPLTIPLTGTGVAQGALSPNPSSLAFGNVQVGSNSSLTETLTNSGGSSVTISAASANNSAYTLIGLTLPLTLNAGQNTSFTVKFTPSAAGAVNANLTITSNAPGSPLTIPLTGTGVAQGALSPNPSSLAFGNVQVGSNSSLTETLTNSGGSSVTISAASANNNAYTLIGLTLPLTLNAGQNTSFTVKFTPSAAGAVNANLMITSNAPGSPLTIPLTGTGVAQGALSPNPSSLAFGNVQVGKNSSLSETLTNTGGSSVTISAASVNNSAYTLIGLTLPLTLNAGQSTSFTVKFAPSAAGAANANLTITSNAPGSPLTIPLTGTGVTPGTLSPNPSSLAFGNVQVGGTANLSETLTNTGGSSVTISQANVTGAAFSISGLTLPTTLNPNQSVTFTATFKPTAAGSASGTLSVVSDASNSPLSIPLSGTGTASGQLVVSPSTLAFGTVTVGSSSPLNGSLTASGASVTVTSASIDNGEFVLSGITLPQTLTAGQTVPFTVTFTPTATGATSASLTFTSNASNSPTVETLTGTGKAAAQHSVDLSWSSSTGAVSYNIYRKLSSDPGYSQISSFDTTTAFTDSSVTAGQTYDYVVTAVDGNSQESGYSNMAQAIVPTP